MAKVGRNDSCPCGSGKKYKKCCLGKELAADLQDAMESSTLGPSIPSPLAATPKDVHAEPHLILKTDRGDVRLDHDCFIVFVDETGQEELKDPNFPVFGLGGCAVTAGLFECLIHTPWHDMKNRWFDGESQPLHAADLRSPTQQQMEALGNFFRCNNFCRVAAVVSDRSELRTGQPPYTITAMSLMERIRVVAQWHRFTSMALIFEASERGDRLAQQHFSQYEGFDIDEAGIRRHVRIDKFIGPKSSTPGLEVADFIIYVAGTAVRTWNDAGKRKKRKNFEAVFNSLDKRYVSFLEIKRVEARPNNAREGQPSPAQ